MPEMPPHRIAFLGGNGHCAARLAAARSTCRRSDPFRHSVPRLRGPAAGPGLRGFPGGRGMHLREAAPHRVYAMGIGGLLALWFPGPRRALEIPLLLQAPILWGLERRLMPRVMRLGPARLLLTRLFASAPFQRHFVCQVLHPPPCPETVRAFFDGYARCAAAPDLFAWLTPALLRSLERDLDRAAGGAGWHRGLVGRAGPGGHPAGAGLDAGSSEPWGTAGPSVSSRTGGTTR